MDGLGDFIAGGLGGMTCVLAGHPFDTVKVKMQAYSHLYSSAYQASRKTFLEEGLKGLYTGSTPAILSSIAENAVLFLCYNQCLRIVQKIEGVGKEENLSLFQKSSAGSLSSVFSTIASTPPDQIKCKMQAHMQTLATQPTGCTKSLHRVTMWTVLRSILRENGYRGLFRGLTSTWAREVPAYFLFFGGYHVSRQLLTPDGQTVNNLSTLRVSLAGGLAGCCFWIPVFPVDTVKSRIQVRGDVSGSFWKTLFSILKNEGVLTLYKGLLPTVVRSFPANGALFVTYEYSRRFFNVIS